MSRNCVTFKATPFVGVAFIFYLWTFLPRTVTAARRHSGAPSKVYQWLGPRCRQKITRKNFANRPPNFYRGSISAKFGLDSQNQLPLTGSSFETEQPGTLSHKTETRRSIFANSQDRDETRCSTYKTEMKPRRSKRRIETAVSQLKTLSLVKSVTWQPVSWGSYPLFSYW